jgi:hypothetical protein
MQSILLGVALAVMSVIWWPTPYALAQDAKMARGTVTEISGAVLTVKVRGQEMKFAVDGKTRIEAKGAGTKSREAAAQGRPGPTLKEVLRVGQGVAVTYHDLNGVLHASHVRVVSTTNASGDGVGDAAKASSRR